MHWFFVNFNVAVVNGQIATTKNENVVICRFVHTDYETVVCTSELSTVTMNFYGLYTLFRNVHLFHSD